MATFASSAMNRLLSTVFASFDAFDAPFQRGMSERFLLFPTRGYMLHEGQFSALAAAAAKGGDDEALCVITEGLDYGALPDRFDAFKFPLASYREYARLEIEGPVLDENVLISRKASWGVVFSQEHHAVVGGSAS